MSPVVTRAICSRSAPYLDCVQPSVVVGQTPEGPLVGGWPRLGCGATPHMVVAGPSQDSVAFLCGWAKKA